MDKTNGNGAEVIEVEGNGGATNREVAASQRKKAILDLSERFARDRLAWIDKSAYFHGEHIRYLKFVIPEGLSVLDLGCGVGDQLAALRPSRGLGVDFSPAMIEQARAAHPDIAFMVADVEEPSFLEQVDQTFDVILISDLIGSLDDCQRTIDALHPLCHADTRIVIAYYSKIWDPVLALCERLGLKMPQAPQNDLSSTDIEALLHLANFETIRKDWRQLVPARLLGLGSLINRYLGTLPLLRRLCLRTYLVARSLQVERGHDLSATVLVPCRNERGNVAAAVDRLPEFCDDLEILFVEGHSSDGTLDEIERVIAERPDRDIRVVVQDGKGKGDAMRKGYAEARGEALIIMDGDLTVPPEDIPKFYRLLANGKAEFVNGTRLVYPLEPDAMRFLNLLANHAFSMIFTWLLNQRFTDTLCGTKALVRRHYDTIAANRSYFGDFDPFGDFDLIFGACKLNLKVLEVPIRYQSRSYGETQISRFQHGWLLLRMVAFAHRKLKAF